MRTWTGHKLLATNQAQGWTMHRDRPAAGPSHRPEMLIEETLGAERLVAAFGLVCRVAARSSGPGWPSVYRTVSAAAAGRCGCGGR